MTPTRLRRRLVLAAGLLGLLAACVPNAAPAPTPLLIGLRVSVGEVTAPVALRLPGAAEFEAVAVGAEVPAGGQVQTGVDGQARLDFADGTHLRLAANTQFGLPPTLPPVGRTQVKLEAGKLWASLLGGTLQVETPSGFATLTGAFAVFEYLPGDPATPTDDIVIISCLTGVCTLLTAHVNEQLSDLEQVILTGGTQVVRATLDESALADFREKNPLVALSEPNPTITQPASETPTASALIATQPAPPTPTELAPVDTPPPPTAPPLPKTPLTPAVAASATPSGLLGRHTVQAGETIYCIGRAYGVRPEAIAEANQLQAPYAIFAGDVLAIPPAPWINVPGGAECKAQFPSPYLAPVPPTAGPGAVTITPSLTPASEVSVAPQPTAQIGDGVWLPPYNLSQSGAALLPALAVGAGGRQYALWWDTFDGTRFSTFQPGVGWSPAASAPSIVGATPQPLGGLPTAPTDLRLLADSAGGLHAFWLDAAGDLHYAQNLSGSWSASRLLLTTPLRWEAAADAGGRLHLAYIRKQSTDGEQAGVYYLQASTRGSQWSAPRGLAASPYFRTLAEVDAHLDLAVTDAGEVFVTWDDPQLFYSFFAHSPDNGANFEPAKPLFAGNQPPDSRPQHVRFVPLGHSAQGAGGVLRLWDTAAGCMLFQEQRGPQPADPWSAPVRTLEQLPGCLAEVRTFPWPNGGAFLLARLERGGLNQAFALWDGEQWSEPLLPRISFVNTATNRPATLSCLTAGLSGDRVVALGCDARGDIWGTASQLSLSALLPALGTAWSPPVQVSDANAEAGLPSVTRDASGQLHALWTEVLPLGSGEPELVYARQSDQGWSAPIGILSASDEGPANNPLLAAAPGDQLYAVWSGGLSGQVRLSRAFTRDAANSANWLNPQELPAPRPLGGWPAIAVDAGGRLRVLFTIPFNEDRGLYLTESSDQGRTWSVPQLVFNAAEAGWSVLQDTQLAVDDAGTMHVLVAQGALPPAVDPLGVYYLRSTDGGQSWTGPLPVSRPGREAGYPRLIATRPGELHRLWIENLDGNWRVQHQWSGDGGLTWSAAAPVSGLRNTSHNLGLATDGSGALYLVGVQATEQQSAALFYLRWDGHTWVDRETVPLGFGVDAASGATAALLPTGYLGVLYRVTTSAALGTGTHLVGYTQRPVEAVAIAPLPTLTPLPLVSPTLTDTPSATPAPSPTLNLTTPPATPVANGGWIRIVAILGVMIVIVIIAFSRLTRRRRY